MARIAFLSFNFSCCILAFTFSTSYFFFISLLLSSANSIYSISYSIYLRIAIGAGSAFPPFGCFFSKLSEVLLITGQLFLIHLRFARIFFPASPQLPPFACIPFLTLTPSLSEPSSIVFAPESIDYPEFLVDKLHSPFPAGWPVDI